MSEATMILTDLSSSIKAMKKLHSLEVQKANKAQQDIIDANYRRIIQRTELLCHAVQYAKTNLSFPTEYSPDLINLLSSLRGIGSRGPADQEQVEKANKSFLTVHDKVKRAWTKHYQTLTTSTVSTLKIIKGLDEARISSCISKIDAASAWNCNICTLSALGNALTQADEIIQELKLDQEVIDFLSKITLGKATLADLNDDVLQWLQNEQLLLKIKLSFTRF